MFLKALNLGTFDSDSVVELAKLDKKYLSFEEIPPSFDSGKTVEGKEAFKLLQKRKKKEGKEKL